LEISHFKNKNKNKNKNKKTERKEYSPFFSFLFFSFFLKNLSSFLFPPLHPSMKLRKGIFED